MTKSQRQFSRIASLCVGAALAATSWQAFAGNSWTSTNFGTQCTQSSSSPVPGQPGWTSCGIPDPTIKGFATASGGNTFSQATIYDWNTSGLGIVNGNENASSTGPHALDNYDGQDAIVFGFSNGAVSLTSVTLGWNGTDSPSYDTVSGSGVNYRYDDSDMALYAWTGGAVDPTTLAGFGPASAGWTLIGNYNDVGSMPGNKADVSTSIYSSYWLVTTVGTGTSTNSDAFKVLALAGGGCAMTVQGNACVPGGGNPGTGVPEPGSLALLMAGFAGMIAVRRRRQTTG